MYSSQCKISRFNAVKPCCTVTNVFLANRSPHISAEFHVQLQNLNRKKKKSWVPLTSLRTLGAERRLLSPGPPASLRGLPG